MKKLALFLALVMVIGCFVFAGCNKPEDPKDDPKDPVVNPDDPTKPDNPTDPTDPVEPTDDPAVKSEGVMTYAEFVAAEIDSTVTIETYVQGSQDWWDNEGVGMATFYTQDTEGAYFIYNMPCSEEDFNAMVPGTKLLVTGTKSEWGGEVEITDATYEIKSGSYIAEAVDVTALLGSDELINSQNKKVSFKGMTVAASTDADGNEAAWLYRSNGAGSEGDDLYFNVSINDTTYTFTVESYLCGPDTDVYKAVKELKIGDVIDLEGFLYWYNGINPHITAVSYVEEVPFVD